MSTLPPLNPKKTASGIVVDPQTLERVVPESRRADGSVRKEIKIRRGFVPQEDVSRFRGSKQAQMDGNALPKGHILGWVAPSVAAPKPLSKSAKKNAKRKEKRDQKHNEALRENWEDDDEPDKDTKPPTTEQSSPPPSAAADTLETSMEKLKVT